jgi:transposase
MVWAAFSSYGTTPLVFISTRMKSADYIRVLDDHLLPYMRHYPSIGFTFQHDNASIHSSAETKAWLESKNIPVLPWPAKSPDCNPIENLWGILTRDVYSEGKQYDNADSLKTAILAAWSRISKDTIEKLVNSMHGRIIDVIKKGGKPIDK